jgi:hypothetical protein
MSSVLLACATSIAAMFSLYAAAQSAPAKSVEPANAKASPQLHLEELKLLALGPNEGRAVFQFPDHSMQVVRTGEPIPGLHATLIEVQEEKAVIEETIQIGQGKPGAQKQTVWMSRSQGGAAGKIQRFSYTGDQPVSEKAPNAVIVPLQGPPTKAPAGTPKNSN